MSLQIISLTYRHVWVHILVNVCPYESTEMSRKSLIPIIDDGRRYSPREAAELLGVTPETVKSHCRKGKLKAKKVGPKQEWRILGSEIRLKRKEWQLD